jgi:hypothetical protein
VTAVAAARSSVSPATTASLDTSRRTVRWLVRAVAVTATLASIVHTAVIGSDAGVLTLPVIAEAVLVVLALEVSRTSREPLRIDALTLFTAWEAMRGCATPAVIQWIGNGDGFLYRLGTHADTALVLWLAVAFFLVVVMTRTALLLVTERTARGERSLAVPRITASRISPWALVGIGSIGMVIRFPSPSAVAGFLSGAVDQLQGTDQVTSSGITLLGMLLRPLLFVGLVLVARERRRRGRPVWPVVPPLVVSIVFGLASYGLNRATVAYAVIGMVLVFSERSARPLRARHLSAAVGLLGSFFVLVGTLRASLWVSRSGLDAPPLELVAVVQSAIPYFGTPMQLAAALPAVRVSDPFSPMTFLLSVVSSVPGAPEIARTASSTAVYNHIVYHSFLGKDQLLPFWYEGFLCFGLAGVVGAGVLVGVLQAVSDRWRSSTSTVLGSYAAALFVLWIAQASVTSIGVIEQNFLYFVLTPLGLAVGAALWPGRRPSGPSSTDDGERPDT